MSDPNQELINSARRNWVSNNSTQDFIKELRAKQTELFNGTMNLSICTPPDKDAITRNMIQAKTIENIIILINK